MVAQRTSIAAEPQTVTFAREATPTQDWGASFQRFIMVCFGMVCSLCVLVTLAGSFIFPLSLAASAQSAIVLVGVSLFLDAFKVGLPLAIYSFRHREPTLTMLATWFFAVCLIWSTICGIGWAMMISDRGYSPQTLQEAGSAATSGLALFLLMLAAQGGSVLGPLIAVAGTRYAKDIPDEELPPPPREMDFGMITDPGDGVSEWIREAVGMDRGNKVYLTHAYDSYVAFCRLHGHKVIANKQLAEVLASHTLALTGQKPGRDKSVFFPGITLSGQEKPEFLRIAN